MRILNLTTTVGALALTAAALGACGSADATPDAAGSTGEYCKELKADKAYFQNFDSANPDLSKLDEAFTRMHSLASLAPPPVADDWKVLDDAITTIREALDEAGLDFDDLAAMQNGEIPPDVDLEELEALGPKLEALGGSEVEDAAASIEKHAHDECGVDLTDG